MNPIKKHTIETEKVESAQDTSKDAKKEADEGRAVADTFEPLKKIETDTAVTNTQKDTKELSKEIISTDTVTNKDVEEFNKKLEEDKKLEANKTDAEKKEDEKNPEKKKGFFDKSKDFVKKYPWTSLVLGWVGITAGVLLYKWIWGKKNKNTEKWNSKTEKKWFWDHGFGKFLKYSAIGWWAYYGIHGITTGKWWLDKLFDWEKETDLQSNEDKTESYEEAMKKNPEQKETYEGLGDATDQLYNGMFGKELASGWQDDWDMETIAQTAKGGKQALKWVVPRCIGKENWSINEILSSREQSMSFLNATVDQIKQKALWLISNWMWSIVGYLASWFWIGSSDSKTPKEDFMKIFDAAPEKTANQIKFYYREKVRIQTFLLQKEKSLVQQLVKEKAGAEKDPKDIADLMEDKEWLKDNIYSDPRYTNYRSGSLENAYKTLKNMWLMNWDIDKDTQEIITEMDADRDDTLNFDGKNSVLERASNDLLHWSIEQKNKEKLLHVTTKINKELQGDFMDVAKESAWNVYSDLFDGNEQAKRTFMQESGMDKVWGVITQALGEYTNKISNGTITSAEMKDFNFLVNSFYAFKKEVYAGASSVEYIHNPDGSWTVKAWDFLGGQLVNLGTAVKKVLWGDAEWAWIYVLSAMPLLLLTGMWAYIVMNPLSAWKKLLVGGKYATKAITNVVMHAPAGIATAGSWTAKTFGGKVYGPSRAVRKRFYNGTEGAEKLINDFRANKISLAKAWSVFESGNNAWNIAFLNKKVRNSWSQHASDAKDFQRYLIKETFNRSGTNIIIMDNMDTIVKYYDMPVFEKLMKARNANYKDTIELMKKVETISLSSDKKLLLDELLKNHLLSQSSLEKALTNIPHIDDGLLWHTDVKKLAEWFARNASEFDTVDHANAYIKALQDWEKGKQATKTAAKIVDQNKNARKDAKALWLTSIEQVKFHEKIIAEIDTLEYQKTTLAAKSAIQTLEKDVDALKWVAEKLSKLSVQETSQLLDVSKDIKLSYLAKIFNETSDIKGLMKGIEECRDVKTLALLDTAWNPLQESKIAISKLEDLLGGSQGKAGLAPWLLEDLKQTGRLEMFADDMVDVVSDVKKISKIEKVWVIFEKILNKVK